MVRVNPDRVDRKRPWCFRHHDERAPFYSEHIICASTTVWLAATGSPFGWTALESCVILIAFDAGALCTWLTSYQVLGTSYERATSKEFHRIFFGRFGKENRRSLQDMEGIIVRFARELLLCFSASCVLCCVPQLSSTAPPPHRDRRGKNQCATAAVILSSSCVETIFESGLVHSQE